MDVEAYTQMGLFDLPDGIIDCIAHALADNKCATGAFRCTCKAARAAVRDAASHLALQHADGAEVKALLAEFAGVETLTIQRTCDVSDNWNGVLALPRLCSLNLATSAGIDLGQLTALAGRLTALTLDRRRDGQSEALADVLPQLTRLRKLVLLDSGVRTHDVGLPLRGVAALTALTALTRLSLGSADGVAVAALAQRLPQLAHLALKFGFGQEQEHNAQVVLPASTLHCLDLSGCTTLRHFSVSARIDAPWLHALQLPPSLQACTLLEQQYAWVPRGQMWRLLDRLRGLESLTSPMKWLPHDVHPTFGRLTELRLRSAVVDANVAAALAPVAPRLRILQLWYCHAGTEEDMLRLLQGLRVAEHVSLEACHTRSGSLLTALRHLGPTLESLNAKGIGKVTDEHVRYLQGLTRLTSLRFSAFEVMEGGPVLLTDAAARVLARLTALRRLRLSHADAFTDAGLAELSTLTRLTNLRLPHCRHISAAGIEAMGPAVANLRKLKISGTGVSGLLSTAFSCGCLTKLILGPADGSDTVWQLGAGAPGFQGLRELSVAGGALDDAALADGLARLTSLRRLELKDHSRLNGKGLAALRHCPRIAHISVRECPALGDAGLFHLARGALRTLSSLEVWRCPGVTVAALDALQGVAADVHGRQLCVSHVR